jgi:hypothetical protein
LLHPAEHDVYELAARGCAVDRDDIALPEVGVSLDAAQEHRRLALSAGDEEARTRPGRGALAFDDVDQVAEIAPAALAARARLACVARVACSTRVIGRIVG